MRISLLADSTVYLLAGEAGVSDRVHASAVDFRLAAQIASQSKRLVRAAYDAEIDRANLRTTISFSTRRVFDTALAAFTFAASYDRTYARQGIVVIEAISPAGTVTIRHLLDAVVRPPRQRLNGCTLYLDYSASGGQIIASSGIPANALLAADGSPILAADGSYILTSF